ncbi:hypothetical protein FC80_GL001832 [Liquorilactobacillus cacaonum DSM 21116]|uniref:Uncharacterized protein n=1 Tax=Liquorilactobacillus cacaonum DSM 21116 TaxID=1423729 RepID=A0A0R2CNB1_9LACO|nr:hypothetical protein FC80_GL001832 [Liquorilactobacillus cacaonum DSM 21116]
MMVGGNHEVEIPAFVVWAGNAARETVILVECDFFNRTWVVPRMKSFRPNYGREDFFIF